MNARPDEIIQRGMVFGTRGLLDTLPVEVFSIRSFLRNDCTEDEQKAFNALVAVLEKNDLGGDLRCLSSRDDAPVALFVFNNSIDRIMVNDFAVECGVEVAQ